MTQATYTTRPEQHPERDTVRAFAASLPTERLAPIGRLVLPLFLDAADAFDRARARNQSAAARADGAQAGVRAASEAFGTAFDRWSLSLDDVHGKGFARRELPVHLGNRPASVFLKTGARSRVQRTTDLLAYADATPGWRGGEVRRAELEAATAALDRAVGASEDALRERAEAGRGLRTAALAFDKRWGNVVDALRDRNPELALEIPRFRRAPPRDRLSRAEPPNPVSSDNPSTEPEHDPRPDSLPAPARPLLVPPSATSEVPMILLLSTAAHAATPPVLTDRHFGLGVGSSLRAGSAGLPLLDRYSVRFQFGKWAVDPAVTWDHQSANDPTTHAVSRATSVDASADLRYYAARSANVELVPLAGGAASTVHSHDRAPTGSSGSQAASYEGHVGVGLEWASSPDWSFGVDAVQPLGWYSVADAHSGGASQHQAASGTALGLGPKFDVAFHLYF